jgi:hypothetical protein
MTDLEEEIETIIRDRTARSPLGTAALVDGLAGLKKELAQREGDDEWLDLKRRVIAITELTFARLDGHRLALRRLAREDRSAAKTRLTS